MHEPLGRAATVPVQPEISVVVPCHDEGPCVDTILRAIVHEVEPLTTTFEIVLVDDGSTDDTFARIEAAAGADPRIRGVQLTRNFGKEAALLAGLRESAGDAVITMDADMQHPPSLLPRLVAEWRGGADVVDGVKAPTRGGSSGGLRRALFNTTFSKLAGFDMHAASDFKLLDRAVADTLAASLPERRRFYRGLTEWSGFRHARVEFDVGARAAGRPQWSLRALVRMASTALFAFTSAPLRIVSILGLLTLALAVVVGAEALWSWHEGRAVSGFATVILTLLLIGSFIMISLGVVGEYVGGIYDEIKRRPHFVVRRRTGRPQTARPAGRRRESRTSATRPRAP